MSLCFSIEFHVLSFKDFFSRIDIALEVSSKTRFASSVLWSAQYIYIHFIHVYLSKFVYIDMCLSLHAVIGIATGGLTPELARGGRHDFLSYPRHDFMSHHG